MGTHLVEPGMVLADRYVVEDLLAVEGGADSWRARDKILARSVVVQLIPSASPYAGDLLAAAKKASRVPDPRILQVLDAVDDGRLTYVVREWATGQTLEAALSEGPLSVRRATWLMREVAGAITNAHRMGLPHRRLAPDTVVLTKSSGIKVIGLGTFAALRGLDSGSGEPEYEDAQDLGRLLYACLTARWPGAGDGCALPAAPTEHGRLLRPRQVRAGVPRDLDALCDRILGRPPRFGEPITSVAEIKKQLSLLLTEVGFSTAATAGYSAPAASTTQRSDPPPALFTAPPHPSIGGQPGYSPVAPATAGKSGRRLGRTLMWVVVAVLVVGAMLLAYLVGQQGKESAGPGGATPASVPTTAGRTGQGTSAAAGPVPISSVVSFDPPPGSGNENPDQVQLAIDDSTSTYWSTLNYLDSPTFGGLKRGVGLVLDLGRVRSFSSVTVGIHGGPTSLQLRAAPAGSGAAYPTSSASQFRLLGSATNATGQAIFSVDRSARARYLLVRLTSLPSIGGNEYRGDISDISVTG